MGGSVALWEGACFGGCLWEAMAAVFFFESVSWEIAKSPKQAA